MGSKQKSKLMGRRRVLITGGSGFIGTNAVEYFVTRGYDVVNLDTKRPRNKAHLHNWRECDILDAEKLCKEFTQFDPTWVLHLAARTDLRERSDVAAYAANTVGVENTVKAIRMCKNIERVLFTSSRMVCRIAYQPKSDMDYCPPNPYGESKVIGERIVHDAHLNCSWVIVRPTSIWGPWFEIPYRTFFTTIARRLYMHPGRCNPKKSFGYVANVIYSIERLMEANRWDVDRKTMYLCDYPPLELREWSELIRLEMGLPAIPSVPVSLLRGAGYIGDLLSLLGWYGVPITSLRLDNLMTEMIYESGDLAAVVGPLPYSLGEGVRRTVQWMRDHDGLGQGQAA